ncbi:MAG: hypothetical protein Q8R47_04660 [Nanoarchaeota archaeon]|nr:hypothetical protein [Nanoarchaeota archaeon]
MEQKSTGKFLFQSLLLMILLVCLALKGFSTSMESIAFAVLLLVCVVSLVTYKTHGEKILFVIYSLFVLDIVVLWLPTHSLYFTLLLVCLLGLWISMPSSGRKREEVVEAKPSAPPQKVVDGKVVGPKAESKEKAAPTVKAKFTPGKYVASKRSNVYHEPKCEWAKKIQKDRRLWFASREEALNKGYKKHDCVK